MQSFRDSYAAAQARQVAEGKAFQCPACQHISYRKHKACPKCHAPISDAQYAEQREQQRTALRATEPKQLIKVYDKGNIDKAFREDAAKLAKDGWRVQSQSYGGQKSKVGAVLVFGALGLAGGRKASEMTVIYVRD